MQDTGIEVSALEALRELAGVVGQAAETLWPMAVKATWANSVSLAAFNGFFMLLALVAIPIAWKLTKRIPKLDLEPEPRWVVLGVVLVVCAFVLIGSAMDMQRAVPGLIAPEGVTLFKLLK